MAGEATATPKAREVIPIFFAIVTDGQIPGRHNLLHVSAHFSETLTWSRNIQPQHALREQAGLGPELLMRLQRDAIPVGQAMEELTTWLERFQGRRLPVTSSVAYWHLLYHLSAVSMKIPLLNNPLDVSSFYAGAKGDLGAGKLIVGKDPTRTMAQRQALVAEAISESGSFKWE